MAIIAPPSTGKDKPVTVDKKFLLRVLSAKMRELVSTEDGRQMTVAQAMAERLTNVAMFAESNSDAIMAQKLIYERLYGKAAVMKTDEVKPMPKVVFALNDMTLKEVDNSVNKNLPSEDNDEIGILVETDDGKEMIV
nr:MAG TPA: hypothetical protein [Caudoviricetes sp.]